MKTQNEIQRAHDMLVPLLIKEVPTEGMDETTVRHFHACLDALCWVLEHDHNIAFQKNMDVLEDHLRGLGYILSDHGN